MHNWGRQWDYHSDDSYPNKRGLLRAEHNEIKNYKCKINENRNQHGIIN